jgi:hypothetical protein
MVSWALGAILVAAASYGLLADHPYRGVQPELAGGSRGQDVLTLVAVPVLIWAGYRSRAGSLRGHLLWLGVVGYVAYADATYLIGVPHNDAFLLYAAAVGLSTAALLDGLLRIDMAAVAPAFAGLPRRGVGWFLIVTGEAFALLWLADIVPAIPGDQLPRSLGAYDMTSPIHVLDLTFVLPAVISTGVLLVRGHPAGPVLGTVVLAKIMTLGLSLEVGAAAVVIDGLQPDPATTSLFVILIVVCGAILVRGARGLGRPDPGWLRPQLSVDPDRTRLLVRCRARLGPRTAWPLGAAAGLVDAYETMGMLHGIKARAEQQGAGTRAGAGSRRAHLVAYQLLPACQRSRVPQDRRVR